MPIVMQVNGIRFHSPMTTGKRRRTAWTKVTVLIVALLAAMVLPGCPPPLGGGDGDPADGDPADGDGNEPAATRRYSLDSWGTTGVSGGSVSIQGEAPSHYRAWNTGTNVVGNVMELIHTPLLRRNQETLAWEPALAESFSVDSDAMGMTITLREELFWSDGSPLTVDDVLFSVAEVYQSATVDTSDDLTIDGTGTTWVAQGERSIRATSTTPYAAWEDHASFAVLPEHILAPIIQSSGAAALNTAWAAGTAASQLVGSGPFRVQSAVVAGNPLVLEANPHYFEADAAGTPLPYLSSVTLEPGNSVDLYVAGTTDLVEVSGAAIAQVEGVSGTSVHERGPNESSPFVVMNQNPAGVPEPTLTWLSTKEFRQAIAHLVDRAQIVADVYAGEGIPRYSPISPSSPYYWSDAPSSALTYDVASANTLLDNLGWTDDDGDGFREDAGGNRISLTLATNTGNTVREAIVQTVADGAALAGIEIVPSYIEFNTLVSQLVSTYDWELILIALTSSPDPISARNVFPSAGSLHMIEPNQVTPRRAWEATVDAAFAAAATTSDDATRKSNYQTIQEVWLDEVPWIYTADPRAAVAAGSTLGNVASQYLHPFSYLGIHGALSRVYWN